MTPTLTLIPALTLALTQTLTRRRWRGARPISPRGRSRSNLAIGRSRSRSNLAPPRKGSAWRPRSVCPSRRRAARWAIRRRAASAPYPYPNPNHNPNPNPNPNPNRNPDQAGPAAVTALPPSPVGGSHWQALPKPYPNLTLTLPYPYNNLTLTLPKPYPISVDRAGRLCCRPMAASTISTRSATRPLTSTLTSTLTLTPTLKIEP